MTNVFSASEVIFVDDCIYYPCSEVWFEPETGAIMIVGQIFENGFWYFGYGDIVFTNNHPFDLGWVYIGDFE